MYEKEGKKTYTLDVIVNRIEFLGSKQKETSNQEEEQAEENPFKSYGDEIEEQQEIDLNDNFLE